MKFWELCLYTNTQFKKNLTMIQSVPMECFQWKYIIHPENRNIKLPQRGYWFLSTSLVRNFLKNERSSSHLFSFSFNERSTSHFFTFNLNERSLHICLRSTSVNVQLYIRLRSTSMNVQLHICLQIVCFS